MSESLRVGVLADTVDLPGGIGRYVREFLGACAARTDVRLTVATSRSGAEQARTLAGSAVDAVLTAPRDGQLGIAAWQRYALGRHLRAVDVVIGTKHLVPRTPKPTVLVVHDVLTITRAAENAPAKRLLLPAQFRASLRGATALVAVSEATRDRLGTLDPTWAAKCTVIPNGMSTRLLEVAPAAPPGMPEPPFALAVGDLSPRKNLGLLARLWETAPPDLPLVLVGPDAGTDDAARAALTRLEAGGRLTWIRGADDAALRWCYEHAAVLLFPSFEEGFGLPVLEAMTFRLPVIAGTDAAVREVAAGDPSVRHCAPTDLGAWREALRSVPSAPRGAPAVPQHAITWAEHADRLLGVARSLIARR